MLRYGRVFRRQSLLAPSFRLFSSAVGISDETRISEIAPLLGNLLACIVPPSLGRQYVPMRYKLTALHSHNL